MQVALALEVNLNWRRRPATPVLNGLLVSYSGGSVQITGTMYVAPTTLMLGAGALSTVQLLNPGVRTLNHLRVMLTAPVPVGASTLTAQVNVNGVDNPTMLVTFGAGEQVKAVSGSIELADLDVVAIKFVQTGVDTLPIQALTLGYTTPA